MTASECEITFQINMSINWRYASIGSGNGLSPDCQQAITWTKVDQDVWYHLASKGHNELQCELLKISLELYICSVVCCFMCIKPIPFKVISLPLKQSHKNSSTQKETVNNIGVNIRHKLTKYSIQPNQTNATQDNFNLSYAIPISSILLHHIHHICLWKA